MRDFFNQSESAVKQNQRKHSITFDTHLKSALSAESLMNGYLLIVVACESDHPE